MPEFQDFQKRMPSVDRTVSGIKQDDIRVAIIGAVIDSQENRLVIDDGTGKVTVNFEQPVAAESANNVANEQHVPKQSLGQLVRIMGRVIPMDTGVEIQGDVLQPMGGMDIELKKSVDKLTMNEK